VLLHGEFLGYISKVKMNSQPEETNLKETKIKIPIKLIYTAEVDETLLKIKFTFIDEGRIIPKEWVIKYTTVRLAENWKQLIDY
jgi:hypothetical protein